MRSAAGGKPPHTFARHAAPKQPKQLTQNFSGSVTGETQILDLILGSSGSGGCVFVFHAGCLLIPTGLGASWLPAGFHP